jgi:hypothetical protein
MCSDSPLQPRRPYNRNDPENPDNLDKGCFAFFCTEGGEFKAFSLFRREVWREVSQIPTKSKIHPFPDERRGIVKEIERGGLGSDVDDDGLSTVEVEAGLALSTEGD